MAKAPQRTPSSDELDYQRRLDENFAPEVRSTTGEPVEVYAPFTVEDNDTSAYVGVSPEYMTYADDTHKPLRADGGVEADREARIFDTVPVVATPATEVFDQDTSTQGAGASSDLVYTAASGEGFTAQKAEAPAEEEGAKVEEPATEQPEGAPVAPKTTASPAAKPPVAPPAS